MLRLKCLNTSYNKLSHFPLFSQLIDPVSLRTDLSLFIAAGTTEQLLFILSLHTHAAFCYHARIWIDVSGDVKTAASLCTAIYLRYEFSLGTFWLDLMFREIYSVYGMVQRISKQDCHKDFSSVKEHMIYHNKARVLDKLNQIRVYSTLIPNNTNGHT